MRRKDIAMEKDYCYIDDVLENCDNDKILKLMPDRKFSPENYNYDLDNLDPDAHSHKLYNVLAGVLSGKIGNTNKKLLFKKVENSVEIVDEEGRRYGSDYIGPNCTNAHCDFGYSDCEIGSILKKTRILGGHMIWIRRNKGTINQIKGGKGIYDRIDLCLAEIRHWYERGNEDKLGDYKNGLWNAIVKDKEWFAQFEEDGTNGFINFIDFFMLNDFVDLGYNVISLSCSNLKDHDVKTVDFELSKVKECSNKTGKDTNNSFLPGYQFGEELSCEKRKEAFNRFVWNNIMLIELRTERMKKSI